MKHLFVTTCRSGERLDDGDLRGLSARCAGAGAGAGIIARAGSIGGTRQPPKPGSAHARPNGAPAYYLGRPASLWIGVTSPRARRQHA
jgi:hypothetical protein